jgi:uncharacterized protein (UPF0248 family)
MSAGEGHVYRVHLVDPGGRIGVQDVPTDAFEATERGLMLNGTTIVPWHRVVRYTRDVIQPLGEPELAAHTEVRVWLDDGSEGGETLHIRADRFDPGPWTVDFLEVEAVNVEGATIHMRKVHVPWGRVLEYERVRLPVEQLTPVRPD